MLMAPSAGDTRTGTLRRWTCVVARSPGAAHTTLCTPRGTLHPLCRARVWSAAAVVYRENRSLGLDRLEQKLFPLEWGTGTMLRMGRGGEDDGSRGAGAWGEIAKGGGGGRAHSGGALWLGCGLEAGGVVLDVVDVFWLEARPDFSLLLLLWLLRPGPGVWLA